MVRYCEVMMQDCHITAVELLQEIFPLKVPAPFIEGYMHVVTYDQRKSLPIEVIDDVCKELKNMRESKPYTLGASMADVAAKLDALYEKESNNTIVRSQYTMTIKCKSRAYFINTYWSLHTFVLTGLSVRTEEGVRHLLELNHVNVTKAVIKVQDNNSFSFFGTGKCAAICFREEPSIECLVKLSQFLTQDGWSKIRKMQPDVDKHPDSFIRTARSMFSCGM